MQNAFYNVVPAHVERASACQIGEVLLLSLAGTKPTPCHEIVVVKSLIEAEPPRFEAQFHIPDTVCIQITQDYVHQQAFVIGGAIRDEVIIHRDGEPLTVPVEHLPESSAEGIGTLARNPGVVPTWLREPVEGRGVSRNYDIREAVDDAIRAMPAPPPIPDWLARYEIVSMVVEQGGFAGLNQLAVTVRRHGRSPT
jgi:hypothetical protein